MPTPADGDVVIRQARRDDVIVHVVQIAPDIGQIRHSSLDAARATATALARRLHVRVWLTDGDTYAEVADLRLNPSSPEAQKL